MKPQILLSLDYELFFGAQTGTVDQCLLRPTEALAETVKKHGAHLSLFVDALYLQRLAAEVRRYPRLQQDLDAIRRQLQSLGQDGHDIQLHIHPHWIDSHFDGDKWQLDTTRYKLHDFAEAEITALVGEAKELLTNLVGESVFAFRAGGWCLQPFAKIAPALLTHNIWLDSTVFAGGVSDDKNRWFDFSAAPLKDHWCFNIDPNSEAPEGPFLEVPISAMSVNPLLFWRMALSRKILLQTDHKAFGDGLSLAWGRGYYLQRLTRSTVSVASMDGFKANLLGKAFRDEQATGKQLFHAMGHPKALSRYSLTQLDKFLETINAATSVTFQDFQHLRPPAKARPGSNLTNKESV